MANNNDKSLSVAAQKAAVQAEMNQSRLSLDEVAEQYPSLTEGVEALKAETASKKKPKGARGGSILPMNGAKRRTIL